VQLQKVFNHFVKGDSSSYLKVILNKSEKEIAILTHQLKLFIQNCLSLNSSMSVDANFRIKLNEIEVLKDRFLHKQALKQIRTLHSNLLKHERFNLLQELLLLQIEIMYFILPEHLYLEQLDSLIMKYQEYRTKSTDFYLQKTLFFQEIGGINQMDFPINESEKERLEMVQKNKSALYYYRRRELVKKLKQQDYIGAAKTSDHLMTTIEESQYEFSNLEFQQLEVYFVMGLAYLLSNRKIKYKKCCDTMTSIKNNNHNLEVKYQERINYLFWIEASIKGITSEKESILLDEIKKWRNDISIVFQLRILELISNYHIALKKLKIANQWNRNILDQPKKNQISEFTLRAELRSIYINIERKKMDFGYTLIDRILTNKNSLSRYDNDIIVSLRNIRKDPNRCIDELINYIHFWKYPK
jgi:hypothetical protein